MAHNTADSSACQQLPHHQSPNCHHTHNKEDVSYNRQASGNKTYMHSCSCCMQVPIIAPIRPKKAEMLEQQPLKTNYSNEFLAGLMENPELVRNIAVVGHLHHGKTLVGFRHLLNSGPCIQSFSKHMSSQNV